MTQDVGKTVYALAAKPFQRPVTLADGTPQPIADLADDIDLTGRDLTTFARDVFQDAITDGIAYILVDYPVTPSRRACDLRRWFDSGA